MSIPNIEFLDKLFVFIGASIILISGFFIYDRYKDNINSNIENTRFNLKYVNVLQKNTENLKIQSDSLGKISSRMSEIVEKMKVFPRNFEQLNKEFEVQSKIYNEYSLTSKFNNKRNEILLDSLFSIYDEQRIVIKDINEIYHNEFDLAYKSMILGILILIVGIISWKQKEEFERLLLVRQNLDKPTFSDNCQSCGKRFNSVIVHGTNADGKSNYHFCKACYYDGHYYEPDLTLELVKARVNKELLQSKTSKSKISRILKFIEKLDRWKINNYK